MARRRVRYYARCEVEGCRGLEIEYELPLDEAPVEIIQLASLVHGRDVSDDEYNQLLRVLRVKTAIDK